MKYISMNFTIHYTIKSLYMALEFTSCLLYCAWATALEVGGIFGCMDVQEVALITSKALQPTSLQRLLGPSMMYSSLN